MRSRVGVAVAGSAAEGAAARAVRMPVGRGDGGASGAGLALDDEVAAGAAELVGTAATRAEAGSLAEPVAAKVRKPARVATAAAVATLGIPDRVTVSSARWPGDG